MDRLGAEEPCICKFGLVEAGTVCNAVAGEAHLAGSLRVFTDSMLDRARAGIRRALEEACAATGCTYDSDFAEGYPPVDNDPALFALAHQVVPEPRAHPGASADCRGFLQPAPPTGCVLPAGLWRSRDDGWWAAGRKSAR